MEATRWLRGVLPIGVLALLVASTVGGARVMGAADAPWEPPPCPGAPAAGGTAAGVTRAWYRLAPTLDRSGSLDRQHLTVGLPGHRLAEVDLPPESFATGPVRGQLLVGDDDGQRSQLRVIDLVRDCVRAAVAEAAVIRSAVLAPDLDVVWEHRVDRATRADLGVWRRAVDGGPATRMLPGLPADDAHGPTFVTDLRLGADGRLVVASCGELVCRTRILDPAGNRVVDVDGTGPAIGVAEDVLVAYDVCIDSPCPILAVDPSTDRRTPLIESDGPAELGGPADTMLVAASAEHGIEQLDIATGARASIDVDARLAPVRRGSAASAGADLPAGQLLLAPGGRLAEPSDAESIDPASDTVEPLEEVQP